MFRWYPGTETIIKRRDVRFHEELTKRSQPDVPSETPSDFAIGDEEEEYAHIPLQRTPNEENINEDNGTEEESLSDEEHWKEESSQETTKKRGPGRPRKIKTGNVRRPRKV